MTTDRRQFWIIKEVQNFNSDREGRMFFGTLRGAKISASRQQAFEGTTLKIEYEDGRIIGAFKEPGKPWE